MDLEERLFILHKKVK